MYSKQHSPSHLPPSGGGGAGLSRIFSLDEKTQRHSRNPQRQKKIRTGNYVADGFLKTNFLPKLRVTQTVQACTKSAKTERDFYRSLSQLAVHYGIEPLPTQHYGYPYNIALALWDTEKKLQEKVRNWDSLQLVQDSKRCFLISKERYRTGATLYYIPVIPLYQMLKDRQRKSAARLLLSICIRLYCAGVPYYRQEGNHLHWQYETMKEMLLLDDANEYTPKYLSEFKQAERIGDLMQKKISNRSNLKAFQARLDGFKIRNEFDGECYWLAKDALKLFLDYPNESIFRNTGKNWKQEDDDTYDNEIISLDKYLSFYAGGSDLLYESLSENINSEFSECSDIEEPCIYKRFNGSNQAHDSFDFEERFFTVTDKLCYLLNSYKQ
jgi:hypothetical protein